MDHNDPSRRQYAPTSYPGQQQQQQSHPGQTAGPYGTPGSVDRYRQQSAYMQHQQSPSTASRASHDAQNLYNFSQGLQYATGSVPSNALQYGQDYQQQEPRGQQQQQQQQQQQYQQYQPYGSGVMYGLQPGQTHQQPTQPSYDPVQQYRQQTQQRPPTAAETLPAYGAPQANPQYYLPSQTVPSSNAGPSSDLATPHLPSQYQHQHQPAYQSQQTPQPSYTSTMLDPSHSASTYGGYSQQQPQQQTGYGAQQEQMQQPAQQASAVTAPGGGGDSVDQAFTRYQTQIRNIFTNARDGNLRDSTELLISVSMYLLGSAEGLGLTRDDETLHDDRIRLWDEFNRAWLTTLQAQFDLTSVPTSAGPSTSTIEKQGLEKLARELVQLCDGIAEHGLVDYQMGVAEEEIMDLLLRCLAVLDASGPKSEGGADEGSIASAHRRP